MIGWRSGIRNHHRDIVVCGPPVDSNRDEEYPALATLWWWSTSEDFLLRKKNEASDDVARNGVGVVRCRCGAHYTGYWSTEDGHGR